jgi:hypothetical protein
MALMVAQVLHQLSLEQLQHTQEAAVVEITLVLLMQALAALAVGAMVV